MNSMNNAEIEILCLDDLRINEDSLNASLKKKPISHITHVQNRDSFFSCLEKQPYHCILIGDLVDASDRLDLIKTIATQYPQIPQIIYSSDSSEKSIVNAIRMGAVNYVSKSNLDRLGSAIMEATELDKNNLDEDNLESRKSQSYDVTLDLPGLLYQLVRDKAGKLSLPYTNTYIDDLTGLTREELREDATSIFNSILKEDRQRVLDGIEQSAKDLTLWEEDFQVNSPKGDIRWIRGISTPRRQEDGSTLWNGLMIDVTREHRIQEELIRSAIEKDAVVSANETRQQAILDTVIDGIICIDDKGTIESANKAAQFYFGYEEDELIGKNISTLMIASDARAHDGYLANYLDTGETNIINQGRQVEGRRKDGSVFPLDLAVSEMIINGETKFTGVVRDISERVNTDFALRKNEERLRLSQRFSNLVTWEWNIKNDDLYWSHRLDGKGLDIGGFDIKFQNFIDNIYPEDRSLVMEAIQKCLDTGDEYRAEHRTMTEDGMLRWVEEKGNVVRDKEGAPDRMIGVAQDITTRKESEQQLKEAQSLARLGNWEYKVKDQSVTWSDDLFELFGIDKEAVKPSLEIFFSAVHEANLESAKNLIDVKILAEFPEQKIDYQLVLPNGEIRWVHVEAQTRFDLDNKVTGLRGIVQDINERKQTEQGLIVAKEEAERAKKDADQANKSKSIFLSRMSHELRTPLNAILGFTQLLELETDLSAFQSEAISEIHIASDHLLDLINDVLDLSKIESGKAVLSIEPVKIENLFLECENLIAALAQKDEIQIQWINQIENQYFMYVDRIRIKQVLLNLLSNAVKYNRPQGSVEISTELRPDKMIRIKVTDTGFGIPLEQQKNLFTSFNRLGAEFSEIEGTGIGLVIAKRLIELMGGAIGFKSNKKGTTFWIDTPFTLTKKTSLTQKDTSEDRAEFHDTISSSFNILHIEGNSTHLRLIQQIMASRSLVNLVSTHDNEIALQLAIRNSPDLILVDVNSPAIKDLKLIQALKENKNTLNIHTIALGSGNLTESSEKQVRQDFDDYITNPINVRKLLKIVDRMSNEKTSQNHGLSQL